MAPLLHIGTHEQNGTFIHQSDDVGVEESAKYFNSQKPVNHPQKWFSRQDRSS